MNHVSDNQSFTIKSYIPFFRKNLRMCHIHQVVSADYIRRDAILLQLIAAREFVLNSRLPWMNDQGQFGPTAFIPQCDTGPRYSCLE